MFSAIQKYTVPIVTVAKYGTYTIILQKLRRTTSNIFEKKKVCTKHLS